MNDEQTKWKSIKKDIERGEISTLYLFYGEENYLKEYYLTLIKNKTVGDNFPEFNIKYFDDKLTADSLFEALESYPMMSDKTLIIVRDFNIFNANEAVKTRLTEMLNDMPEHCCLVFVYGNIEFKADKRTVLYKALSKNGCIINFERAGKSDLISWIKRRFSALNHDISSETAEFLMFYCGELMMVLIPEIEKVAAFTRRREISRKDIEEVATPNPYAVIFDLTDALASKNYNQAILILEKLKALNNEPIPMVAMIAKHFRQLYSARLILDGSGGENELMKLWEFRNNYPAKRLLLSARKISLEWLRLGITLCAETDIKLKTSSADGDLEILIAKLSAFSEVGLT